MIVVWYNIKVLSSKKQMIRKVRILKEEEDAGKKEGKRKTERSPVCVFVCLCVCLDYLAVYLQTVGIILLKTVHSTFRWDSPRKKEEH